MKRYVVSGKINKNEIKEKSFSTLEKANSYMEKVLGENSLAVTEIISEENGLLYVCNDYSRISVSRAF